MPHLDVNGRWLTTGGIGKDRTCTAVVLIVQACKVGLTLLAPQSPAGKPDVETAAANPKEDGSGGRLLSFLGAAFSRTAVLINILGIEAFGKN